MPVCVLMIACLGLLRYAQKLFCTIVDFLLKAHHLEWLSLEDEMTALFQAMRMEKLAVSLILSVIIAVASFNIIASLVLSINKKRGEIAVLRTMGASSKLITIIFLVAITMARNILAIFTVIPLQ